MSAVEQPKTDGKEHSFEEINQVGKDLMHVLAGRREDVKRDPGLLITNEDVRRIHRYVKTGLELPTDLERIKQLRGSYNLDIAGLAPADIQKLYKAIHDHALSWTPLEALRDVGSDLYVFSGSLIETVELMVELIKGLESWSTLKADDLTPEQIAGLPSIGLPDGDRKQLPGLIALVGEIERLIAQHSVSTQEVKSGVTVFKRLLWDEIAPDVSDLFKLTVRSDTKGTSGNLNTNITRLNQRINEKIAEYEGYAKYQWVGFWWGPVGGAISWGIYGPKANTALKEKDELIAQKQGLEQQLEKLDDFSEKLRALKSAMQDIQTRVEGALTSAGHIESLWVLLAELVESTQESLKGLDDGKILVIFVSRFKESNLELG